MIYIEYIEGDTRSIWQMDDNITKERMVFSTLGIYMNRSSRWLDIKDREKWASVKGFDKVNILTPEDLFLDML